MVKSYGVQEKIYVVDAHESQIAKLGLASDGGVFASASVKGTLIRIFNADDGTCLKEVRRGTDKANVHSIDLSHDLKWLLVSSAKGTVHVFCLEQQDKQSSTDEEKTNKSDDLHKSTMKSNSQKSSLSFMKAVLPRYFSSEWSFAKYHVPVATQFDAAFGADNCVLIIGMDGSYHKCIFDAVNGGMIARVAHRSNFLTDSND